MRVAVEAVYENGVLKLEKPLDIEALAKVRVIIDDRREASPAEADDPTGWKTVRGLIGCITEELVESDVSVNHDHYLYGAPRK